MRDLRSSCCELLQARHLAILTLARWSVIEEAFCQSCCCWNLIQASCFNTCKPHICNRIMTYWKWKLHSIWKLSEGPVRRPFWTILNKNWYFAPKQLCKTLFCPFGAKKSFLSEMVQKGPDGPKRGPKWSKRLRLIILVPFGAFWTTFERWQTCHVWPFVIKIGPFLASPCHERWTSKFKRNVHHQVSYFWPLEKPQKLPLQT